MAETTSIQSMSDPNHSSLFPPQTPFLQGHLPLQEGHSVYYEVCGHPQGVPVVFLHGGPGSGCSPKHRQLFNPARTRVVLFDQRGCGRSHADQPLKANTTAHLMGDMERLRQHLGIDRWLVVGGSWGAGLGLAYASAHPEACLGVVLRGVFLSRPSDLQWFFSGARICLPDAWDAWAQHLGVTHPDHMAEAVMNGIAQTNDAHAMAVALAWQAWENALTQRNWNPSPSNPAQADQALLAKYRLQSHYLRQHCFFPEEGLLSRLNPLHHLPIALVHGRLDWVCLPEAAWAVHQALPHSQLTWVDHAGHSPFEPPMTHALIHAIESQMQTHFSKG